MSIIEHDVTMYDNWNIWLYAHWLKHKNKEKKKNVPCSSYNHKSKKKKKHSEKKQKAYFEKVRHF